MYMKNIFVLVVFGFTHIAILAQVPQAINFQAQARGEDGKLLENKSVKTRFSIFEVVASGTPVYVESHSTNTDNSGMFNLIIGNGTASQGFFKSINWAIQPKYLKVELDAGEGTGFKLISIFQLASVPYALYAAKADTSMRDSDKQKLSVAGNQLAITNGNTITLPNTSSQWSDVPAGLSYNKKVGIGTNTPRSYLDVVSNEGASQYSINASNTNSKGQAGMAAWNDNGGWLKLSLGGSQLADGAAFGQTGEATAQLLSKGAQDMLVGTLDDKSLLFGTNNLPRLSIKNNGKVGVGTVNPTNHMDIRANTSDDGALISIATSSASHFLNLYSGSQADKMPFISWKESDPLRFVTASNLNDSIQGFNERLRITSNGHVGIGTIYPSSALSVNGVIETMNGGIKFPDGTTQTTANLWTNNSADISFANRVGIGTSNFPTDVPARVMLKGVGTTYSDLIQFNDNDDVRRWHISLENSTDLNFVQTGISQDRLFLKANGNIGIGTRTPSNKLTVNGIVESTNGGIKFPDGSTQSTSGLKQLNKIVFLKQVYVGPDAFGELWMANYDGTNQTKINVTLPSGINIQEDTDVKLSPDGTKLFFTTRDAANDIWHIYSCQVDGSNPQQIVTGIGTNKISIGGAY